MTFPSDELSRVWSRNHLRPCVVAESLACNSIEPLNGVQVWTKTCDGKIAPHALGPCKHCVEFSCFVDEF